MARVKEPIFIDSLKRDTFICWIWHCLQLIYLNKCGCFLKKIGVFHYKLGVFHYKPSIFGGPPHQTFSPLVLPWGAGRRLVLHPPCQRFQSQVQEESAGRAFEMEAEIFTHLKSGKAYCWWTKSCTSWNGSISVYPIIYKVLYIPGGAGFRPSTVWSKPNLQVLGFKNVDFPGVGLYGSCKKSCEFGIAPLQWHLPRK